MSESRAANGIHTTKGRPNGFSSLTPFLAGQSGADAIGFYCDVFGATAIGTTEFGDLVVHAELTSATDASRSANRRPSTTWSASRRPTTAASRSASTSPTWTP